MVVVGADVVAVATVVVVEEEDVGVSFPVCAPVIPVSQLIKSVSGSAASAGVATIEIKNMENTVKARADLLQPMQNLFQSSLINHSLQNL